jgi:succinyl-CoA synthetase alpha subunit
VTVQTLFCSLADGIPGAMKTVLVPGQVTAEEAAEAIALKNRLAVLTADPVIIADSLRVVAKHKISRLYQNSWQL